MDPNQQPNPANPNTPVQSVPTQPGYQPAASTENPGNVFGILSIVLPIIGLGLIGLILGIIGLKKSKTAGQKNVPAVIGISLSAISILAGIIVILTAAVALQHTVKQCQELGPGTHHVGNTTYTCS